MGRIGELPSKLDSAIARVKAKLRDLRGYAADPAIAKQIAELESWLKSATTKGA